MYIYLNVGFEVLKTYNIDYAWTVAKECAIILNRVE